MAYTTFRAVLLMCVIIHLIRGVYLLNCPRYLKYEVIEKRLLDDRAACRAMEYSYEDTICLDGYQHSGFFCATGSCNVLGSNCDGHCLTGDDSTDRDEHDFSSKCSNTTALSELEKLCKMYNDERELIKYGLTYKGAQLLNHFIGPLTILERAITDYYTQQRIQSIEERIINVCTIIKKD